MKVQLYWSVRIPLQHTALHFHLTPTHTVFNCTTTNSILRFSKNSRRYTSQDSSFLRTSQYSHYWENMRQRRSFSFPSSHYCTNFSLYLKKSLFHAGAFVSDGILAASSRVALAKVDLRSRELINRSVLPHKHLDGLRSVLFVHPMPDFATSTLSLSNVAVTAPYWLL